MPTCTCIRTGVAIGGSNRIENSTAARDIGCGTRKNIATPAGCVRRTARFTVDTAPPSRSKRRPNLPASVQLCRNRAFSPAKSACKAYGISGCSSCIRSGWVGDGGGGCLWRTRGVGMAFIARPQQALEPVHALRCGYDVRRHPEAAACRCVTRYSRTFSSTLGDKKRRFP